MSLSVVRPQNKRFVRESLGLPLRWSFTFFTFEKKKLLQEPLANKNRFQRPVFAPKTEVTGLGWNQKPIYLDMDFRFISDIPISVFAAESDMTNFTQPNEYGISRRHTALWAKQWPNATRQNSTAQLVQICPEVKFGSVRRLTFRFQRGKRFVTFALRNLRTLLNSIFF